MACRVNESADRGSAIEVMSLRRTQSLKNLSGVQERSWVMPAPTRWDRKSVSQLVQRYQSCDDLRSSEKAEHKLQVPESCVEARWRRLESKENVALQGSFRSFGLSRSRSMDVLPQREASGTRALCALFESKATLQQRFNSSPRLNSTSAPGKKTGRDCPLQDWRSHNTPLKDTTIQRTAQLEGEKATNGLPKSYDRPSRYSHDDKYSPSLTKGGTPTRQARDRISTSSSIRDRSALYLSRAAAIDSTGASTQPEFIGTPGTRTKNSKFLSPAKEMCSACLTPVYPMEKMVANKLILHKNCFCCKHCKKKLSIHNYSSLYGEFYCMSHYQQLFKRKGNYDEGFGHQQHKDRWLQKSKGIDEPDPMSTPKMTKSNINTRESSAGVFVTKSFAREMVSGADIRGKLKVSWPPEKKSTGVNLPQRTYAPALKNKIPDFGKAATISMSSAEHQKSPKTQLKISQGEEMKDNVKKLSNTFISGVKEQSKTTDYDLAEKLHTEEPKPGCDPTKAGHFQGSISQKVPNFSSPFLEKGNTVTSKKTEQTNVAPTIKKSYNPTSNRLDAYSNKAKKFVRFAPNVDVAQYDQTSQLTSRTKHEELSKPFSDRTELSQLDKSKEIKDINEQNNFDHLSSEFSEEQHASEVNLEPLEYKCHGVTTNILNTEHGVKVEGSQKIPQTGDKDSFTVLNGVVEKVEESLHTQSFTKMTSDNSAQEGVTHQEPSEKLDVIPRNSENGGDPDSPAKQMTKEEASLESDENKFEKPNSANEQENYGSQKKVVAKTNSFKGSVKQAEKTKVKLGSWSKGKSPLSKLFTSSGNEKTNKVEPKEAKKPEAKPSGGLLGRLFQSSSEKTEDTTKSTAHGKRNDNIHGGDKRTEEVKEAITKEKQKEGDTLQVPPLEQESGEDMKDKSASSDPNTLESNKDEAIITYTEPSNLDQTSTSEIGDDLTGPSQTDINPTDDQSRETIGLSVTDPGIADSKDPPSTVQSKNQVSEESVCQSIAEKSVDASLSDPFNDSIFVDSISSVSVEPQVIQINTDECVQKPDKLLDAPDLGGRNLNDGALFDLNQEPPLDSSDLFGPSESQEIFVNTPAFSATVRDTALSADASAESVGLLDSKLGSVADASAESVSLLDSKPGSVAEASAESVSLLNSKPGSVADASAGSLSPLDSKPGSVADASAESLSLLDSQPGTVADASAESLSLLDSKPGSVADASAESVSLLDAKPGSVADASAESLSLLDSKPGSVADASAESLSLLDSKPGSVADASAESLSQLDTQPGSVADASTESVSLLASQPGSVADTSAESLSLLDSKPGSVADASAESLSQLDTQPGSVADASAESVSLLASQPGSVADASAESLSLLGSKPGSVADASAESLSQLDTQPGSVADASAESVSLLDSQPGSVADASAESVSLLDAQPGSVADASAESVSLLDPPPGSVAEASAESLSLLDSQPGSVKSEVTLGMADQLIDPNSAPVNQNESQAPSPFTANSQTKEQDTDFDIFSSNGSLFTPSPAVSVSDQGGADASTNQLSAFPDDIFGVSEISSSADVFTVLPCTPATPNSLNDFLGSDTISTAAPSAQADLFAVDIFASEPQLLPLSEPSDANSFVGSLLVSENNNTQQAAENAVTDSSWMDDLLG
ncbi:serine-rich adhesin for platelets-like [Thunnus maccoyii]|uniref:serine-rich adhesin for platelets-like n=1 Tax=Thunnus maccoyii TaxID=8240 RepID=UPI001C4D3561|nr:serine-rich adhesin for platelets-like [Thunnus maccoyii]